MEVGAQLVGGEGWDQDAWGAALRYLSPWAHWLHTAAPLICTHSEHLHSVVLLPGAWKGRWLFLMSLCLAGVLLCADCVGSTVAPSHMAGLLAFHACTYGEMCGSQECASTQQIHRWWREQCSALVGSEMYRTPSGVQDGKEENNMPLQLDFGEGLMSGCLHSFPRQHQGHPALPCSAPACLPWGPRAWFSQSQGWNTAGDSHPESACISPSASVGSWGGELHSLSLDAGSEPLSIGKPSSLAGIKTNMTERGWSHNDGMARCRTWGCHWKSTSSAAPCSDCLAQQSVQSDGMYLVETCCPALSLPATLDAFFFPLRNYINRWLSLILIHLFQHLHRASVEEKKKKQKTFADLKKDFFESLSWIPRLWKDEYLFQECIKASFVHQ